MKCPYCGEEMEYGIIQSPNELNWKIKEKFIANAEFNEDAIILAEGSFIKGSAIIAYNCRKCKKIIIDYKNNSDANKKGKSF